MKKADFFIERCLLVGLKKYLSVEHCKWFKMFEWFNGYKIFNFMQLVHKISVSGEVEDVLLLF